MKQTKEARRDRLRKRKQRNDYLFNRELLRQRIYERASQDDAT